MIETKDKNAFGTRVHSLNTGVQMLRPYVNFQVLTVRVAQMR